MGCLRLFALCSANTYSPFLFFSGQKLSSNHIFMSVRWSSLSSSLCHQWFFFSEALSKMALFSDSHSAAPSARACQEVCLPKLEPGPVYTNSWEKYGRIIILVVSFNVTSLWRQPRHTTSLGWGLVDKALIRAQCEYFYRDLLILQHEGAALRKIRTVWSEANKHEAQGGDRVCCGCPTHKYRF